MTDIVIICGTPRSGTSFLHDALTDPIFSGRFIGLNVNCAEMDTNPFGTYESDVMNQRMMNNNRVNETLEIFINYWKNRANLEGCAVIYKHPQAVFYAPFDIKYKACYVVCRRAFDSWIVSASRYKDTIAQVMAPSPIGWIADRWGDWNTPTGVGERLRKYHTIFDDACVELLENSSADCVLFDFDRPKEFLLDVLHFLGIDLVDSLFTRHWHRGTAK